jgi:transposase
MCAALFSTDDRQAPLAGLITRRLLHLSEGLSTVHGHERQTMLDIMERVVWSRSGEEPTMSQETRRQALEASALVHPNPEAVSAALFVAGDPFFFALDKVQVKYEMLRSHVVDGISVTDAAAAHGYSRGGFYLVTAAFAERGMAGLVDERRGRRGPLRVTDEIVEFLRSAPAESSGAALVGEVERRFGVALHKRTVERARR